MTESQVCCAVNLYRGRGHSYDCRHRTMQPSRLVSAWHSLRAWWSERSRHDDTDPLCRHHWDDTAGGECGVCREASS